MIKTYPSFFICSTTNALGTRKEPIRICTQFQNIQMNETNISKSNSKNHLMEITLYNESTVFFNKIGLSDLNKQLSWNDKFTQILKQSLSNKNKNIAVQFDNSTLNLKFYTQLDQNSIRILLFTSNLIDLHRNPLLHFQQMCRNIGKKNKSNLQQVKLICKHQQKQIQKVDILSKSMVEQCQYQMAQAKQIFVSVVNNVKRKLQPHFGIITQNKDEDSNTESHTRSLYKIKIKNNRQSQNFMNLFS